MNIISMHIFGYVEKYRFVVCNNLVFVVMRISCKQKIKK